MGRSKWKGPFLKIKNIKTKKINFNKASRNSKITPNTFNKNIKIYNGKNYLDILVSKDMIGYGFGEFSFTRSKFFFKKKKLKK